MGPEEPTRPVNLLAPQPGVQQDQLFWGGVPRLAHILSRIQTLTKSLQTDDREPRPIQPPGGMAPVGPQDPNLRKKTKRRTLQALTDEEAPPTHASWGLKGLKSTRPGDPVGSRSLLPHPPQTDTTASETHLPAAVGVCQHTSSPGGPGSPGLAVISSRRSASPLPGLKSEMLMGLHGPSSPADPNQAQPCLHPSPDKERPRPLPGGSVRGPSAPWVIPVSPPIIQASRLEVSILHISLPLPSRMGAGGPQSHRLRPQPLIPQQGVSEQISDGLSLSFLIRIMGAVALCFHLLSHSANVY